LDEQLCLGLHREKEREKANIGVGGERRHGASGEDGVKAATAWSVRVGVVDVVVSASRLRAATEVPAASALPWIGSGLDFWWV
jgi:hypothetical protein